MEIDRPKPFSSEFVLKTTAKNMRKSVDLSIQKTFDRIPEFAGDQEKSSEIFKTLTMLHSIRKQIDSFQFN